MHALLKRQLKRLGLTEATPPTDPASWTALLERVAATYAQADNDRYTLERSMDKSSSEMQRLYQELEAASRSELAAERDKLQRTAATLQTTVDASPDGIFVIGSDGEIVMFNRRYCELWGIAPEVARALSADQLRPLVAEMTEDPPAFLAQVRAVYAAGVEESRGEVRLRDGRVFELCCRAVRLPTGTASGHVWFLSDVTHARAAQDELRRVNAFLDSIVENIPDMIFVKDAETLRFVRLNRAGEALLGIARADLIGKSDADFFPPDQVAFFAAKDREVLASGTLSDVAEEPIDTPAGVRFLHTKKIPICDAAGRPRYLLGISRDITEAKQAARHLREAKEAAEQASRVKSGFLSNMSHEMRTPLNAIVGFARVLGGERIGPLTERQGEYVQYILRAGAHMLTLVNDLLDLRRIEEGRDAIAVTRLELRPVVDAAIDMVRTLAEEKQHALAITIDPALPNAMADRRAVLQILVNLLSNAVKFTPAHGRIEVLARSEERAVVVAVQDNGAGIDPADQTKLFTYYEQLGAKHEHHMRGSGIGLALTRALVEKLGGHIQVTSQLGEGSRFEFSIPRCTEAS